MADQDPVSQEPAVASGRRIIRSLGWLSGGQFARALIALPAAIVVARYLGPEKYGVLSYASALVGLFAPLAALGLSAIVVRDLVRGEKNADETMGSAFLLRFLGATVVTVLAVATVLYLRPGQAIVHWVVAIAALRNIFAAFDVIDYWFQSQVISGHVVLARLLATALVVLVQFVLVLSKAPLIAFAIAIAIESVLAAGFFCYAYRINNGSLLRWAVTGARARELLYESWPLTATGLAFVMQAYIDQVMLGQMIGDESVGQYSVAIQLIGAIAFLPAALQKSWAPSVTAAKLQGEKAYERRLSRLYQMMFALFLIQGIPTFILAEPIVTLLYGVEYAEAGALLALLAIRLLFTNYGLARSVFIANESLFRHAMVTAFAGTVVNVVANYLLIPQYGARGAIIATILSFFVSLLVFDALRPSTRKNLLLMISSPFAATASAMRLLTRKSR